MKQKEQINEIRQNLMQVIRQAVEKENNCIGTFYKNKGCRSFLSQIKEEYDNSPIVVIHNTDFIASYGDFEPADVVDLYVNTELRLMCTVNGFSCEDWDEPVENVQTEGLIAIVEWLQNQGFVPEDKDEANPYRCAECGSKDVQRMAWVLPNKGNLYDGYSGNNEDSEENYCENCNEHVEIMSEDELLEKIEVWKQKSGYQGEWDGLTAEEKIEVWNLNKEEK